jgi:hypothetical protein
VIKVIAVIWVSDISLMPGDRDVVIAQRASYAPKGGSVS